jgi:hydrogenase expression/formation protein HypC
MCLAVPGRIVEVNRKDGLRFARVDFGGVSREVCLDYVPAAVVGDYCIVHVGFAIRVLGEAEAQETLSMLEQIAACGEGTPTAAVGQRDGEHGSLSSVPERSIP